MSLVLEIQTNIISQSYAAKFLWSSLSGDRESLEWFFLVIHLITEGAIIRSCLFQPGPQVAVAGQLPDKNICMKNKCQS